MTRKLKRDDDAPMTLRDCTQGDLVVIVWRDHDDMALNDTEQIVRVCSTPRTKASTTCMVELIDPQTLIEYPSGVPELCGHFYNAFAINYSIEVLCVVEHSRHVRVEDEKHARSVDVNDPLQGA